MRTLQYLKVHDILISLFELAELEFKDLSARVVAVKTEHLELLCTLLFHFYLS